ncbi:MAG: HAD family hydrolase [Elusimicrobia bacterium]|nr:HAD family hydrolase [Elusimicrobiota bacterium]
MKAKKPGRPAVFLDRDGVIVREVDYLSEVSQLAVLPGVPAAMKALRAAGFRVVVVTNQSGVARGYFSLRRLAEIHRELKKRLARAGAKWDALYFSPHHPDSAHPMRKPGTGMLKAAKKRFGLDLKASYLVGDTTTDVKTAHNAGCVSILVKTGHGGRDRKHDARPDKTCRDLPAAARWILTRSSRKAV